MNNLRIEYYSHIDRYIDIDIYYDHQAKTTLKCKNSKSNLIENFLLF